MKSNPKSAALGFATRAIHLGYDPMQCEGALVPPVYLTSTFAFESTEVGMQRFAGENPGYIYSRVGNPTVALLEGRLASLGDLQSGASGR
jgi:O-acetylhomoserine/O-acetylserine sulfhydrylase-like pyridoxal-dependent enzyme